MSYQTDTVAAILSRIERGELVLPAIQRDFVWRPDRIFSFLDSLLRGYPFGTLLFWNTKARIQYRPFVQQYSDDIHYDFQIKDTGRTGTVVLDGQQRLQSLYLTLYGTHFGKEAYLDVVNSGVQPEHVSEHVYRLAFLRGNEAAERNTEADRAGLWISLPDIMACKKGEDLAGLTERCLHELDEGPFTELGRRVVGNLSTAYGRFKADQLLSFYVIDKNYGDDVEPLPVEEILEIFVRINSGGQVLTKSDLMFSLMQLQWEDAYDEIEEVRTAINGLGEFDFSKDFVLRCALVCCGSGARYDVDKLRDPATLAAIRDNFDAIGRAIRRTVEFVVNDARIRDERILGSTTSLIPFVYYVYHRPGQESGSEGNRLAMKHSLYLALMTSTFSRFPDSRIDGAVREVMDPARSRKEPMFPHNELAAYMGRREGRSRIDDWLLQRNISLLMNILENGTELPKGKRSHRPEYDHVFPASKLGQRGVEQAQIDHYANLRLASKRHNIWKGSLDPRGYFEENPQVAQMYLIDVELLDYDLYDAFLRKRRRRIWQRVAEFLGIPESEIPEDGAVVPGEEFAVIEDLEGQLRDLIDRMLSEVDGPEYWKARAPGQTRESVKRRIDDVISRNPAKSWQDYATTRSRLNFCDMPDYEAIILAKPNWPVFDSVLGRRGEVERHLAAVRRLRNSVMHGRDIDEVERLSGEAGILYLRRAVKAAQPTREEPETHGDDSSPAEGPTREDFDRLLTRIPLPNGQKQLYCALYRAGEVGLSYNDLVSAMGRRDRKDLVGVLGALGNRCNGTPGYGATQHPGGGMVLAVQAKDGDWHARLTPAFTQYLKDLNPPWLEDIS